MKRSIHILLSIVLLTLSPLAANAAEQTAATGSGHGARQTQRFVATIDADGVQRVEMVGGDYFYDPAHIVVKVRIPVELKIRKAAGNAPHNLIVQAPEAGIAFTIELEKEPRIISFTPTKTGSYPLFCDKSFLWFKTHRERGMEGMIEVVE